MNESSRRLLDKAARAIEAAETLLEHGYPEFATGRAYYATFYTTEALLNEKDLHFSKHGGVHGAFGEHYVKTGLFDASADPDQIAGNMIKLNACEPQSLYVP